MQYDMIRHMTCDYLSVYKNLRKISETLVCSVLWRHDHVGQRSTRQTTRPCSSQPAGVVPANIPTKCKTSKTSYRHPQNKLRWTHREAALPLVWTWQPGTLKLRSPGVRATMKQLSGHRPKGLWWIFRSFMVWVSSLGSGDWRGASLAGSRVGVLVTSPAGSQGAVGQGDWGFLRLFETVPPPKPPKPLLRMGNLRSLLLLQAELQTRTAHDVAVCWVLTANMQAALVANAVLRVPSMARNVATSFFACPQLWTHSPGMSPYSCSTAAPHPDLKQSTRNLLHGGSIYSHCLQ